MRITTQVMAWAVLPLMAPLALFVLLGQVTVRKLRKNSETKDHLGISLASGWDIINVANAFSEPKKIDHYSLSL